MREHIAIKISVFLGSLLLLVHTSFASEITGTLATGTTTPSVSSQSYSSQSVSSGGGGGGGMVVPSAGYSYGGGVNYNMNSTTLAQGTTTPVVNNGGGVVKGAYTYRPIAQAGLYNSTNLEVDLGTDTRGTDTTATITEPMNGGETIMPTSTNTVNDVGPYDFLGISVWFWLVLLVLVILIIAVLYMQSL